MSKSDIYNFHRGDFMIRAAQTSESAIAKQIVFDVLREYGLSPDELGRDADLNDFERHYFNSGGFFGVVEDRRSGTVVGTFGLYAVDNGHCELRKMYVLKNYRGQGLGRWVLESAIEIAGKLRFSKVSLETISCLKEAIALYKSFGFHEVTPTHVDGRVDQAFELDIPDSGNES